MLCGLRKAHARPAPVFSWKERDEGRESTWRGEDDGGVLGPSRSGSRLSIRAVFAAQTDPLSA